MTIPNVLTFNFKQNNQKFPISFEWFGTELARIGTGNKGKEKGLGFLLQPFSQV